MSSPVLMLIYGIFLFFNLKMRILEMENHDISIEPPPRIVHWKTMSRRVVFKSFIHWLLKRERVREYISMDDSYKSKGHLGVSFQSYQVSTCHAKHCTNTRRNYKTISTIGVATTKEISILETWWSIEPRKWMLRNWTIKFFWLLNCDLISNSWCNLASKHVFF